MGGKSSALRGCYIMMMRTGLSVSCAFLLCMPFRAISRPKRQKPHRHSRLFRDFGVAARHCRIAHNRGEIPSASDREPWRILSRRCLFRARLPKQSRLFLPADNRRDSLFSDFVNLLPLFSCFSPLCECIYIWLHLMRN